VTARAKAAAAAVTATLTNMVLSLLHSFDIHNNNEEILPLSSSSSLSSLFATALD